MNLTQRRRVGQAIRLVREGRETEGEGLMAEDGGRRESGLLSRPTSAAYRAAPC